MTLRTIPNSIECAIEFLQTLKLNCKGEGGRFSNAPKPLCFSPYAMVVPNGIKRQLLKENKRVNDMKLYTGVELYKVLNHLGDYVTLD